VDCHRTQELGLTLLDRVPMPASYTHTTSLVIISNIYSNSLHTSFLRVISHHDLYSRLYRLPLKLTALQHPCRSCSPAVDDMRVPEAISQPETQPEIDLIHHQKSIVPQSFGDFGHGCLSRPYTKLTCPSALLLPLPQEKQGDLASTGDEVSYTARDHRSLVNWKKHKLCLLSILLHLHPSSLQPEGTTTPSLQSLFVQTTMEPLSHGL